MSGEVVVFLGPTLPVVEARKVLDATYLPPAAQGDVYRACRRRPDAIALVDGYFEAVPSVWHKELLWAISQGTHVYGCSSMGALRASELDTLGMIGVGHVYAQFRDGILTDDDEVTLAHAPADAGYRPMSEAMVNMRATVADAAAAGIVSDRTATLLLSAAKTLFYPERTLPRIVSTATSEGAVPTELAAFVPWAREHRRDVKREDAITLLRQLAETRPVAPVPHTAPTFDFPYTSLWEQLRRTAGRAEAGTTAGGSPGVTTDSVLDELRLDPSAWRALIDRARLRLLLLEEAQRRGYAADEDALFKTIVRFRTDRSLWEPQELEEWLHTHDLDTTGFLRLMRQETAVATAAAALQVDTLPVIDVLHLDDDCYVDVVGRASKKEDLRRNLSAEPPSPEVYETALAWHAARHGPLDEAALPSDEGAARKRAIVVDYLFQHPTSPLGGSSA